MRVGVPREIKDNEYRVALTPGGASTLTKAGHKVLVEAGAGEGSGFADAEYAAAGARIVETHQEAYTGAELVVKVKEPLPAEYPLLRADCILFTYLHLAAVPELARALLEQKVPAIGYETVQLDDGRLPLLVPMSEVAGRMAVQVGAHYLERMNGGRGVLLGGVTGVKPADVLILGGGVVGTNAATIALGMGASVTVMDSNVDRLRYLGEVLRGRLTTAASLSYHIDELVRETDLLIGGVLIPGASAPRLVTRQMVAQMRRGAVIVDVSVDQGGCVETAHPTTHSEPTYFVDGVLHYCVANMPGAVPRTSTFALSNVTLPYVLAIANKGFKRAVESDPALERGVNSYEGVITHAAVADSLKLPYRPLGDLLN